MDEQIATTQIEIESPPDSRSTTPDSELESPIDSLPLRSVRPDILAALENLQLSPEDISKESRVIGNGMFGDVTLALCAHPQRGKTYVAIKHLRICREKEIISLFEKEVYVWSKFNHPNILPLIGFFFDKQFGYPSFVSEWMKNGSSWIYVKKKSDCDLIRLVTGAAEGLEYLHGKDVIHSDIKPDNIVVNSKGDACICDFGGSRIIAASRSLVRPTNGPKGTAIYSAYELVVPNEINGHTKETDVWAFGMTIYALLAQRHPYTEDLHVYKSLSEGKLPPYPSDDSSWSTQRLEAKETLWNVCQLCWKFDPSSRADIPSILSLLRTLPTL